MGLPRPPTAREMHADRGPPRDPTTLRSGDGAATSNGRSGRQIASIGQARARRSAIQGPGLSDECRIPALTRCPKRCSSEWRQTVCDEMPGWANSSST